jgi:preprotein translocase SecE subunit
VAKAVRAAGSPRSRAPALPTQAGRENYLKEVWAELKKVLWPTRTELTRMTGIVIATVFIFAGIIGIADYGLGIVVRQLYAAPGTARTTTPVKAPTTLPSGVALPSGVPRPGSKPAASAPAIPAGSAPAAPAATAPAAPIAPKP